jgi:hypothetical protein
MDKKRREEGYVPPDERCREGRRRKKHERRGWRR